MNTQKLIFKASILASVVLGASLLLAPGAKAQTFTNANKGSAVRAAFSTVTVGGAATSYAIEVLQPGTVYSSGTYDMTLTWNNTTNPDQANLGLASFNTGAPTELTGSFESAVANAINDASAAGQFENVEAIIQKFAGPNGVAVTID